MVRTELESPGVVARQVSVRPWWRASGTSVTVEEDTSPDTVTCDNTSHDGTPKYKELRSENMTHGHSSSSKMAEHGTIVW